MLKYGKDIQSLDDITDLEGVIEKGLTLDEVVEKYWGESGWYDDRPINDDYEEDEFEHTILAVYNDELDDNGEFQLGTVTVLDDEKNVFEIYREIM